MRAILVSDINCKTLELREEIRTETNPKLKSRLIEEEAAYKLVLRNFKQHDVVCIKAHSVS